jgi:hypothetical protein
MLKHVNVESLDTLFAVLDEANNADRTDILQKTTEAHGRIMKEWYALPNVDLYMELIYTFATNTYISVQLISIQEANTCIMMLGASGGDMELMDEVAKVIQTLQSIVVKRCTVFDEAQVREKKEFEKELSQEDSLLDATF